MPLIEKSWRTKRYTFDGKIRLITYLCNPDDYRYDSRGAHGSLSFSLPFIGGSVYFSGGSGEHTSYCSSPNCSASHSSYAHETVYCGDMGENCTDKYKACIVPECLNVSWSINDFTGVDSFDLEYDDWAHFYMDWETGEYCFLPDSNSIGKAYTQPYNIEKSVTAYCEYSTDLYVDYYKKWDVHSSCEANKGQTSPNIWCNRLRDRNPSWLDYAGGSIYERLTKHGTDEITGDYSNVTIHATVAGHSFTKIIKVPVNTNLKDYETIDWNGAGHEMCLQGAIPDTPLAEGTITRSFSATDFGVNENEPAIYERSINVGDDEVFYKMNGKLELHGTTAKLYAKSWHCTYEYYDGMSSDPWRLYWGIAGRVKSYAGGWTTNYDVDAKDMDGTDRTDLQMQAMEIVPVYHSTTFDSSGNVEQWGWWERPEDGHVTFSSSGATSHKWRGFWAVSSPLVEPGDYGATNTNYAQFPLIPQADNDGYIEQGELTITNIKSLGEPYIDPDGDGVDTSFEDYDHADWRVPITSNVSSLTWDAGTINIGLEAGQTSGTVLRFDENSQTSLWTKSTDSLKPSVESGNVKIRGVETAGSYIQRDYLKTRTLNGARFAKVEWFAGKPGQKAKLYVNEHFYFLTAGDTAGNQTTEIDLCRPDCSAGGSIGGGSQGLQYDPASGQLLYDPATNSLMNECCCGSSCSAATNVQSVIPIDLPNNYWRGSIEAKVSALNSTTLTLTDTAGNPLQMEPLYFSGGKVIVRSGVNKYKHFNIGSYTSSQVNISDTSGFAVGDLIVVTRNTRTHGSEYGSGWGIGRVNIVKFELLDSDQVLASGALESNNIDRTQVTDSEASWKANAYAGKMLRITTGAMQWSTFNIVSNTTDTLTLSSALPQSLTSETEYSIVDPIVYRFDGIKLYRKPVEEGGFLNVYMTNQGSYPLNRDTAGSNPKDSGIAAGVSGEGDTGIYYAGTAYHTNLEQTKTVSYDDYWTRLGIVVVDGRVIGEIVMGGSEYLDNDYPGWGFNFLGAGGSGVFPVLPFDDYDAFGCTTTGWRPTQDTNGVFTVTPVPVPTIDGNPAVPASYAAWLNPPIGNVWTMTARFDALKCPMGFGSIVGRGSKVLRGRISGLAFTGRNPAALQQVTLTGGGATTTATTDLLGWFISPSMKGNTQINVDGTTNVECRNRHINRLILEK